MPGFVLTDAASTDLQNIASYTAELWGAAQALAYLDGLQSCLKWLSETPLAGPTREELGDHLRCFPFESDQVFYLPNEGGITVIRILHQRMDPARHIQQDS